MKKEAAKNMRSPNELVASSILKDINLKLINFFGQPKKDKLSNPLDILIATILSQNTNDKNSFQAYFNLKNNFNNWEELGSEKLSKIIKLIRIAGLGNQKARVIKNLIKRLKQENGHASLDKLRLLDEQEAIKYLTSFKGVGLKTAACVLLFSLNRNVCPVDTHIHRILNRLGIVNQKDRNKTFYDLHEILPNGIAYELHTNLILLGRSICTSNKPKCNECPLIDLCNYKKKNLNSNKNQKNPINSFLLLDNI